MAAQNNKGGSSWLAFVVGALVVVVLGFGFMVWTGRTPLRAAADDTTINLQAPALPELPAPEVPAKPPQSVPH